MKCYAAPDHFHPGTWAIFTPGGDHLEQFYESLAEAEAAVPEWDALGEEEGWPESWFTKPPAEDEEDLTVKRNKLSAESGPPIWRAKYSCHLLHNSDKQKIASSWWQETKPSAKDMLDSADKGGWTHAQWVGHGNSHAWRKTDGQWKACEAITGLDIYAPSKASKKKPTKKKEEIKVKVKEISLTELAAETGYSVSNLAHLQERGHLPKGRRDGKIRLVPEVETKLILLNHIEGEHWVKGRARPGKRKDKAAMPGTTQVLWDAVQNGAERLKEVCEMVPVEPDWSELK